MHKTATTMMSTRGMSTKPRVVAVSQKTSRAEISPSSFLLRRWPQRGHFIAPGDSIALHLGHQSAMMVGL